MVSAAYNTGTAAEGGFRRGDADAADSEASEDEEDGDDEARGGSRAKRRKRATRAQKSAVVPESIEVRPVDSALAIVGTAAVVPDPTPSHPPQVGRHAGTSCDISKPSGRGSLSHGSRTLASAAAVLCCWGVGNWLCRRMRV